MSAPGSESSTDRAPPPGWPDQVHTAHFESTLDGTCQPMLTYSPKSDGGASEKRPLLVALHTWSATFKQAGGQTAFARWCIDRRWHFIHPHFRGPNWSAEACGSDLAVQDVIDAVSYMKSSFPVDEERIYVAGVSGGGHMALLLAGRAPEMWAGVSAWAAITDLRQWWKERVDGLSGTRRYAFHIERVVGGRPDEEDSTESKECQWRSPLTHLPRAANAVNLDINAGVYDGSDGGSVPFTHALHAFNAVVPPTERLGSQFIDEFYEKYRVGDATVPRDLLYGTKDILFRRLHNSARVTIFRGGHEIIHVAALNWLSHQTRGKPAVWSLDAIHLMTVDADEGQSGK